MRFFSDELPRNIKLIEQALGIMVSTRGNKLILQGEEPSVERARRFIEQLREIRRTGYVLSQDDIRLALRNAASDEELSLQDLFSRNIPVSHKKKLITPKTRHQMEYIEAMRGHDIVLGIGPAGTGKTYLAMAMAVHLLMSKQISRVVLARPAVEAGEKLGFLPGDLMEKVNPYLRPLYDALYDMLDVDQANRLVEKGVIEVAPLAFMRGRTLNDSFIILDEAQNTTTEQMKMYLTRLGYNSKTVITGDTTQIDLPTGKKSGLVEAEEILRDIEGIKVVYFSRADVVRHKLVQEIVKAYERHERDKTDGTQRDGA